jgi:hypothetical protein
MCCIMAGPRCRAGAHSLRLGCASRCRYRSLVLFSSSSRVLVNFDPITRQPDQLGIVGPGDARAVRSGGSVLSRAVAAVWLSVWAHRQQGNHVEVFSKIVSNFISVCWMPMRPQRPRCRGRPPGLQSRRRKSTLIYSSDAEYPWWKLGGASLRPSDTSLANISAGGLSGTNRSGISEAIGG